MECYQLFMLSSALMIDILKLKSFVNNTRNMINIVRWCLNIGRIKLMLLHDYHHVFKFVVIIIKCGLSRSKVELACGVFCFGGWNDCGAGERNLALG